MLQPSSTPCRFFPATASQFWYPLFFLNLHFYPTVHSHTTTLNPPHHFWRYFYFRLVIPTPAPTLISFCCRNPITIRITLSKSPTVWVWWMIGKMVRRGRVSTVEDADGVASDGQEVSTGTGKRVPAWIAYDRKVFPLCSKFIILLFPYP